MNILTFRQQGLDIVSTELVTYIILFICAMAYINYFTLSVPYFWDCPLFIFHDPASVKGFIKNALTLTQSKLENDRPLMNLFFYFNTLLFGKNYFYLRIVKNIFFGFYIVLAYILARRFIKDKFYSLISVIFVLFSFPVFVHEVVLSEPVIYTEPIKMLAFLLFLYDFDKEKTSVFRQIFIAILLHLIFKSYSPTYSAFITLFLFTILYNYKKIKRYWLLLVYLLMINFPLGKIINPSLNKESPRVILNTTQFYLFFLKDFFKNLLAIPLFENIYNKKFLQIMTPPLFLMTVFYFIRLLTTSCNKFLRENRMALCFIFAYLIPELIIWFFLPEPASRFFSSQALPTALFISLVLFSSYKYLLRLKPNKTFIILVFLVYVTYNFAYTYMFRATWLSSELGKRKVADYIETIRGDNTLVIYKQEQAAPDYTPLNMKGDFYKIPPHGVMYLASDDFSSRYLKSFKNYKEIYIVQKETSSKKNRVPDLNFKERIDLALVKVVEGKADALFDKVNFSLCKILRLNYQPNQFYIYKYKEI